MAKANDSPKEHPRIRYPNPQGLNYVLRATLERMIVDGELSESDTAKARTILATRKATSPKSKKRRNDP